MKSKCSFLLLAALVIVASLPAGAQVADTLRGRVTTDSGAVIPGAEVVATRAPDRAYKSALTDANGNYQIVFDNGTGDYLLHVSALGRETARFRIKATGEQRVLSHDFQLKSSVQKLETVTVQAAAPAEPERDRSDLEPDPGEAGKNVDGVTGAISPDQAGNIAAAAATVPGVAATPNGISVLGLDPSQNQTTLNGMSFQGADLPRSATSATRVSSSAYDPARGWFSGAAVDVAVQSGFLD